MRFLFFTCIALLSSLYSLAQKQDVKHIDATIELMPELKAIKGDVLATINVLEQTDTVFLNAKQLKVETVSLNGDPISFTTKNSKLYFLQPFDVGTYYFKITYTTTPKQTLYFVNDLGDLEIFTQGQGKYTSHWLPSIDDMTDKIEFDLNIIAPNDFTVIANGQLQSKSKNEGTTTWKYTMSKPMSSYLVALVAGKYDKQTSNSASGVPIELYFEPSDIDKVESTYRHSKAIFDFLEREIGINYPWQNYKQVYVKDFLYAGMENTTTTVFSDAFVVDSIGFIDRNYINVNAHELAHQWFGNLVTEVSSEHHWLHEGFATYYALLAEKELFGDDYYYWKLYQSAEQLKSLSDEGKGEALTNPQASSLTFYEKGAWALHILRETVGDSIFKEGIKSFLEAYKYENATIDNFIISVEDISGSDLTSFKKDWLYQSAFKAQDALNSLKKSPFMQQFLEVSALRETALSSKKDLFFKYLSDSNINTYIGQEIVVQLSTSLNSVEGLSLLKMAFNTKNTLIRQAIAINIKEIPLSLQEEFESLLYDDSYLTKEIALFNLWKSFPQKQSQYLNKLKNIEGFRDKNIELLWLTLSIVTPQYNPEKTGEYLSTLNTFTNEEYSYQTRQNAFNYLYQIDAFSKESLQNLASATTHHVWRFKKFSRELLKELLKSAEYKKKIFQIKSTLSPEAQKYIDSIL